MPDDNYITGFYNKTEKTFQKDFNGTGFVYKNPEAFENKSAEVCYIPELINDEYTYFDFLKIAKGNYPLAEYLFETVDWQRPETLFNELVVDGEIDTEGNYMIFDEESV
jgi:hypothetical protein